MISDYEHPKVSIVLIGDSVLGSCCVLFNDIHFQEFAFEGMQEQLSVRWREAVALQLHVLVVLGADDDAVLGVVGDYPVDDVHLGVYEAPLRQILEEVSMLLKLIKTFDACLI